MVGVDVAVGEARFEQWVGEREWRGLGIAKRCLCCSASYAPGDPLFCGEGCEELWWRTKVREVGR